ncbi:hypothetical protein H4219_005036 [Mycoemilia scoparia]|uniref:Uncharacterized protein n=1 Tax=Mycoemilia scoparia TaxID=417184 RepID=A0A9W7ZQI4_9FUNG|nr:hypothetical protein H4219_005036 [Mycoemilia scoparia]
MMDKSLNKPLPKVPPSLGDTQGEPCHQHHYTIIAPHIPGASMSAGISSNIDTSKKEPRIVVLALWHNQGNNRSNNDDCSDIKDEASVLEPIEYEFYLSQVNSNNLCPHNGRQINVSFKEPCLVHNDRFQPPICGKTLGLRHQPKYTRIWIDSCKFYPNKLRAAIGASDYDFIDQEACSEYWKNHKYLLPEYAQIIVMTFDFIHFKYQSRTTVQRGSSGDLLLSFFNLKKKVDVEGYLVVGNQYDYIVAEKFTYIIVKCDCECQETHAAVDFKKATEPQTTRSSPTRSNSSSGSDDGSVDSLSIAVAVNVAIVVCENEQELLLNLYDCINHVNHMQPDLWICDGTNGRCSDSCDLVEPEDAKKMSVRIVYPSNIDNIDKDLGEVEDKELKINDFFTSQGIRKVINRIINSTSPASTILPINDGKSESSVSSDGSASNSQSSYTSNSLQGSQDSSNDTDDGSSSSDSGN